MVNQFPFQVSSTTGIVETVIVELTVLVEQKPLTTHFYLLLVESPLYWNFFWKILMQI